VLLVAGCGSRSGVLGDAPLDAALGVTVDGSVADAHGSIDASDAGDAGVDASPPCHLVPGGDPFTSIAFPKDPGWSFHQTGLVLRTAPDGSPHVVQLGAVDGAGNDGWGDPAFYAAEYDVSVWPPRQVQPPTPISLALDGAAFALTLPDNRVLFAWDFNPDWGPSTWTTFYSIADGAPWHLSSPSPLVSNAAANTVPTLSTTGNRLVLGYERDVYGDAGMGGPPPVVEYDGMMSSLAFDGTPAGPPSTLWSLNPADHGPFVRSALVRTRTTDLVATYFASCGPGITSAYCEPATFVLTKVDPSGAVQKVGSVQPESESDEIEIHHLASDGQGHNWLVWTEAARLDGGMQVGPQHLFAVPLTDEGAPSGPVEAWYASSYTTPGTGVTVGPVGAIDPLSIGVLTDSGDVREIHLVHRQLEAQAPVEDVSFTTASTEYGASTVQIAEPRSVIVAFSSYPPGAQYDTQGYGALARYVCAEDKD
jgi:hypothetical protein